MTLLMPTPPSATARRRSPGFSGPIAVIHAIQWTALILAISAVACPVAAVEATNDEAVLQQDGKRSPPAGSCSWEADPYACPSTSSAGPKCDGFIDEGKLVMLQLIGRRRMVCLGEWIRASYVDFLCEPCYNFTLHGIRSSDTSRTKTSADLFFIGLFPPPGGASNQIVDAAPTNLYYIQTKPKNEDQVLRADFPCPTAEEEEHRIRRVNPYFKRACTEHEEVRDKLHAHSGYPPGMEFTTMAGKVYDTLQIEYGNRMCLPQWTNSIFPQPLCDLAGLDMFAQVMGMNIRRLRGGPLLTYLASNINNKLGKPSSITPDWTACHRKIYAYSTHARVIANLLGALGYKRTHVPGFGAAVIVELRKLQDPGSSRPYYVKVIYKDGNHIETVQIPGCDCLCPLSTFEKYMEDNGLDITPVRVRQECPACKDGTC